MCGVVVDERSCDGCEEMMDVWSGGGCTEL